MTKTTITGASGFIGNRLLFASDRDRNNITHSLEHQDIVYGNSYDSDKLFFLSTYGNMAHHADYRMMVKANVQDLLTVIKGFIGWICYMSSSSVTLPVQTPYSRTKRAAEEILQALPELKSCIVRPYSVTGRNEQREHLIPTLIRSCMEGEEMSFDPRPVHDFIDVEDVCNGLIRLADEQMTGTFEFGNGIPYSNYVVRELVERECGKKANVIETTGLRKYDSTAWYCQRPFFKGKKSLRMSISEMVDDYKAK